MRKVLSILFAILFIAGTAYAANIQSMVNPTAGPEVWITPVYNNSTSTVSVTEVVIWDVDASTGDNDNYINTTTTAGTHLVAGVVYPSDIAAKSAGTIAIGGIVTVEVLAASGAFTDSALCTSTTAGSAKACATANLANRFGHATASAADTDEVLAVIFP